MPLMIIERAQRGRVEPAAAARAPGDRAALLPDGATGGAHRAGRVDGSSVGNGPPPTRVV
jgi:hypothetical protein